MASKCLKILKIRYECKPESRTPRETGGGGKRRAGPEIEKETRRKQGFVCRLGYLSDASPQRQEMVLLHTGNELMAKIRSDNGWGNQKSMPMQQRGEWERNTLVKTCFFSFRYSSGLQPFRSTYLCGPHQALLPLFQ